MSETTTQKLNEKLDLLKKQIVSNSKDAHWANDLLAQLLGCKSQLDVEAVELIIPTKEVIKTIDFGHSRISKTVRGILYEAKGGMVTFIHSKMEAPYTMLDMLFEKKDDDADYSTLYDAVMYVMQAPIFASLNVESLFGIATKILETFNEYAKENISNAELHEETEEDIRLNNQMDSLGKTLDEISKETI